MFARVRAESRNPKALEVVRCTMCGAKQRSGPILTKESGDASTVTLHRCHACNGVFRGAVQVGYDTDLYSYYSKYEGLERKELYPALTQKRCHALLDRFARQVYGRSLLDVGCGKGDFVNAAVGRGWHCRGIDLAERAVRIGQRFGLPLECTDFFSSEIPSGSHDVVTMFELIEHVPNPADFLKRAEEVVRGGGLVYMTTPNFASLDRMILGADWKVVHEEHLSYFTTRSLLDLIRRHTGLEVVQVRTRNLSAALTGKLLGLPPRRLRSRPRQTSAHLAPRETVEASRRLRLIKATANAVLAATGVGATITVLLRKSS